MDLRIKIINQLRPTANKLIKKTLKRYENSRYAYCFNLAELTAIAEDLMLIVAEKRLNNLVDELGIYNYFTECFSHKCQDIYFAHAKTKKRGAIDISAKDISECNIRDGSNEFCPEVILSLKQELDSVINYLKQYDKPKVPFSKIIKLFLQGVPPQIIQVELNITPSSLDRYKNQALEFLKQHPKPINYEDFNMETSTVPPFYPPKSSPTIKRYISREIKFNQKKDFAAKFSYYCTLELYQENKLIKKNKILLKQEESFNKELFFILEKTDLKNVENEFKQIIDEKAHELEAA